MNDKELQQIALAYAKQNPPQTKDERLKQYGVYLNANMVFKPFLRWLAKTHCIVSKGKVMAHYTKAKKTHDLYISATCINTDESRMIDHYAGIMCVLKELFGKEMFETEAEASLPHEEDSVDPQKCKFLLALNNRCLHINTQLKYGQNVGCSRIFYTGIPCPGFEPIDND